MQLGSQIRGQVACGEAICDQNAQLGHEMKVIATWLSTGLGLLTVPAMLTACDASQWPLANMQSPRPVMQQSSAKSTVNSAAARQKPAKPDAANPAATSSAVASTSTSSVADGTTDPVLIGLNSEQTRAMLGPPAEEEQRAPAKIWRYRTSRCSLDVAFYPDVQTHEFRVLNYEVNGNDGTEQGRRDCIAGLRTGLRPR
jgi:hypothetical protein